MGPVARAYELEKTASSKEHEAYQARRRTLLEQMKARGSFTRSSMQLEPRRSRRGAGALNIANDELEALQAMVAVHHSSEDDDDESSSSGSSGSSSGSGSSEGSGISEIYDANGDSLSSSSTSSDGSSGSSSASAGPRAAS